VGRPVRAPFGIQRARQIARPRAASLPHGRRWSCARCVPGHRGPEGGGCCEPSAAQWAAPDSIARGVQGGFGGSVGHDPHMLYTLRCGHPAADSRALHGAARPPPAQARAARGPGHVCLGASECDVVDALGRPNVLVCRCYSAVQILAVLDRMDVLDYDKVAAYVASLQQVLFSVLVHVRLSTIIVYM
jgi:hypothetical protein